MKHRQRSEATSWSTAAQVQKDSSRGDGGEKTELGSQKRARRGGGGGWRAFISARSRGGQGRADFKALAEAYRNA